MINLPVWFFLLIIFAHFVGDFVLQTQKMSEMKSKKNTKLYTLILHSMIYSVTLLLIGWTFTSFSMHYMIWCFLNGFLHFEVDYFSSDIYVHFVNKQGGYKRGFFITLGIDQLIHYVCLFGSFYLWLI